MADEVEILQGEDKYIVCTLTERNASGTPVAVDVSSPTSITATLTPELDTTVALSWTVSSGHSEEDYENGVVVPVLTDTQTAALSVGTYRLTIIVVKDALISKWTLRNAVVIMPSFESS